MIRVLVWSSNKHIVEGCFSLFHDQLGFRSLSEPGKKVPGWFFENEENDCFSASVTDERTEICFVNVDWIKKVRKSMGNVSHSQLLGISLPSKDIHKTFQSNFAYAQQLAFLNHPKVHPLLVTHTCDNSDGNINKIVNETHVKEIVFGETDEKLQETSNLIGQIGNHRVSPGMYSLQNTNDIHEYKDIVPGIRVIPSSQSTLVIKTPSLEAIKFETQRIGATGSCEGQLNIINPLFNGIDIRITDKEEFETRFVEHTEQNHLERNAVQFERSDMGSMSCTSVNGMELKERCYRIPQRLSGYIAKQFG